MKEKKAECPFTYFKRFIYKYLQETLFYAKIHSQICMGSFIVLKRLSE